MLLTALQLQSMRHTVHTKPAIAAHVGAVSQRILDRAVKWKRLLFFGLVERLGVLFDSLLDFVPDTLEVVGFGVEFLYLSG
jgi:hypothetical protein